MNSPAENRDLGFHRHFVNCLIIKNKGGHFLESLVNSWITELKNIISYKKLVNFLIKRMLGLCGSVWIQSNGG